MFQSAAQQIVHYAAVRARQARGPAGAGEVKVLGIDDFAFRREARYGTILVDLERRRVVDLLPERSQESLVAWLERHPGGSLPPGTARTSTARSWRRAPPAPFRSSTDGTCCTTSP